LKVAVIFANFGPYHWARVKALISAGINVQPIQVSGKSNTYLWEAVSEVPIMPVTLVSGSEESAGFMRVFMAAMLMWRKHNFKYAFLPSYAPASSLALLLSAKCCGIRCIMMNESHAGTERAMGIKRWLKRRLISLFDGAIVGGEPHRRHFVALGMSPETVFTGYDAVDNKLFLDRSCEVRHNAAFWRHHFNLPEQYFLSLGRLVEKKNLTVLTEAFAAVKQKLKVPSLALVIVGSGECEQKLIESCRQYDLSYSLDPLVDNQADVLFYGFRQIDENPVFYSLAEAFVLPSLYEEWGLVVNEAMACGLPVLVSSTVGSAEDLVVPGENGFHFDPRSSTELADHMAFLLEHPEQREQMGLASAERIKAWGCENFAQQAKEILTIVTTSSE
jgi:1,2-diacylglycerol 3-alpha-glucosyltransferase